MFRGGQPNPYDDIVVKATDENLTSENWEIILNLCDKVQDEGEQGARNVVAAILKRLAHRNPNVQLYALALAEALGKNCGLQVHREIASRSFTQGLEKLITDRTAHEKVKRKTLALIAMWTEEFENDPSLSIMDETYTNLKAKNFKFEQAAEPPPPQVDDEIRRREEEELQRVLEMSMHDKGGRQQWGGYAPSSSANAAASASTASLPGTQTHAQPPKAAAPVPAPVQTPAYRAPSPAAVASPSTAAPPLSPNSAPSVTRVRALHTFEPTEPGELAFEKGDIIKVVDRNYKDWWRGQLRGRTGIFPVNYVEPLPEPTQAEISREAEQEATVFAQAANIDKLLSMLRTFDPAKDNLADNEEIQELYRTSMSLRPKIVKLIDKYSQKRADLVFMNESFVKARGIFDRMMEDSLARHTGLYAGRPTPGPQRQGPAPYAWNPALYDQAGYPGVPYNAGTPGAGVPYAAGTPGYGPQPAPYGPQQPSQEGAAYPPQPYGDPAYGAQPHHDPAYGAQPHHVQGHAQSQSLSHPQQAYAAQQHPPQGPGVDPNAGGAVYGQPPAAPYGQVYSPQPPQPGVHQQQPHPGYQQQQHPGQQQPPQQQQHVPGQDPAQAQAQYAGYPQQQQQPVHQQPVQQQQQQQPAPQAAAPIPVPVPTPAAQSGPSPILPQADGRYVFDPQGQYADPNVQLWAQYYAQGGNDPAGSVYFVSVPGVTDGAPPAAAPPQQQPSSEQPQGGPAPDVAIHGASAIDPGAFSAAAPFAAPAQAPGVVEYTNGTAPPPEQPQHPGAYDYSQQQRQDAGSPTHGFQPPAPAFPDASSPPPGAPGYVHQLSNQFGGMQLQEPGAPQAA